MYNYPSYEEAQRQQPRQWEPEPLRIPLYAPVPRQNDTRREEEEVPTGGVTTIDMYDWIEL